MCITLFRRVNMDFSILAPAKINLFLDITGRRKNGYHDIKSIMQSIDLCDVLTFCESDTFSLSCTDKDLACDKTNLVWRAADAFFEAAKINKKNVKITIEKNIPMAAGLAGGSADCAAALVGLNKFYGSPLTEDALLSLGAALGADVPFCIKVGTYITEGIGDVLTKAPSMPDCTLVVAKDLSDGVSTPAAYKALDTKYNNFTSRMPNEKGYRSIISALDANSPKRCASALYNIFEDVILPEHESVSKIKKAMTDGGALASLMSGSGPSVFGIFDDKEKADTICKLLKQTGIFAAVCRPTEKR